MFQHLKIVRDLLFKRKHLIYIIVEINSYKGQPFTVIEITYSYKKALEKTSVPGTAMLVAVK